MNEIEFQLQQLHNLKEQLYQLILGQNDNCHECDKGKLTDFQQVVKVISDSQTTIREELLNILNQGSKRSGKSTLTYSCCEDEIKCYDKQISVSGEIESFIFIFSNEVSNASSSDSPKLKLPPSSIAEQIEKRVRSLEDLLKQVISSVDEQEAYLNDKWANQPFDNPKISGFNGDIKTEFNDVNLFSSSTPLRTPLKYTDTHHWFPNTSEVAIQTINDLDIESNLTNLISPIQLSSESSITCPNYHLSGLTSSEEIKDSNTSLVLIADEMNDEAGNILETVQEMIEPRVLELSVNGSSLSIECINHSHLIPHVQTINNDYNYKNVDIIVDKDSTDMLEICNQQEEVVKLNIKSNECESFTSENDSTDKFDELGNYQGDPNDIDKQNNTKKQPLTIDVLHSILHDIVDNVIKDDLSESETIFVTAQPNLIEELKENSINPKELLPIECETPTSIGNSELEIESSINAHNSSQDRDQDQTDNQKTTDDAIYIEVSHVSEEEAEKQEDIPKSENSEDNESDHIEIKENIYDIKLENENRIHPILGDSNEDENEPPIMHQFNANNENRNASINIIYKIQSNNDLIVPSDEGLDIDKAKEDLSDIKEVNNEKDVSNPVYGFDKPHDIADQGDSLTEVSYENSINESFVKLNTDLNYDGKLSEMKTILKVEVPTKVEYDEYNVVKRENTSYDDSSIIRVSETAEDIQSNENELKSNINSCTIKEVEMKESLIISSPFTIENTNMNVKDDYRPVESTRKIPEREIFYRKYPNSNKFTKSDSDLKKKDSNQNSSLNDIEMEPSIDEMVNKCSSKSLMTETAKLCIPNISDEKYIEDIESINALSLFSALETFENLFTDILINEIDNEIDNETRKCQENEVGKLDSDVHDEAPNNDPQLSEKSSFTCLNIENLNEIGIDYNPSYPVEAGGQSEVSIHPNDAEMFHSTNENRNMRVNVNIVDENPQSLSEIGIVNSDFSNDTVEQENGTKTACASKTESYSSQIDITESLDSQNSKENFFDFTSDVKVDDSVQVIIESEGQIDPEHLLAKAAINLGYAISSDTHKQPTITDNKSDSETVINEENDFDKFKNTESFAHLPPNIQEVIHSCLPKSLELSDMSFGKGYAMCKTLSHQKDSNDTNDEFEIENVNNDKSQIDPFKDSKTDLGNKLREWACLQVNSVDNSETKDSDNGESSCSGWQSENLPNTISSGRNDKDEKETDVKIFNDLACKSEIKRFENPENLSLDHEKTDENCHIKTNDKFECGEIPCRKADGGQVGIELEIFSLKDEFENLYSDSRNLNDDLYDNGKLIPNQGATADELNPDLGQRPNDLPKLIIKTPDQDIPSINYGLTDPGLSIICDNLYGTCESLSEHVNRNSDFNGIHFDVKESDQERVNSSEPISIFEKTNLGESGPQTITKLENNEIEESSTLFSSTNSENEMFKKILSTKYDSLVDLTDTNDMLNAINTSQNHLETFDNSLETNYGMPSTSLNDDSLIEGNITNKTNKNAVELVVNIALPNDNIKHAHLLSENSGHPELNFLDVEKNIPGDLIRVKVVTNLDNTDNSSSSDEPFGDPDDSNINPANIRQLNTEIPNDTLRTYFDTEERKMESNIERVENIKDISLNENSELSNEEDEDSIECHGQLGNVNILHYNTPMESITDLDNDQTKSKITHILRNELELYEDHFDEDSIGIDKILQKSLIDNSRVLSKVEMPSKNTETSIEDEAGKLSESWISDSNVALDSIKSDQMNLHSEEDDYLPNPTTPMSQFDDISPDVSTEYESNLYIMRSNTNEEGHHHFTLNFENELDLSKAFDSSVNMDSYEGIDLNEKEISERNTEPYSNNKHETTHSLSHGQPDGDLIVNPELQFPKEHVLIVSIDNENHIPPKTEERRNSDYRSELHKYINVNQRQSKSDPVIFSQVNENDGYDISSKTESRKGQGILTRSTIQRTSLTILPKIDKPVLKKRLSKSLELYSHSLDVIEHSVSNSTSQEIMSFSLQSEEDPRPSFPKQIGNYQKHNKRNLNVDDDIHNLSKPFENSPQRCNCGLWKFILLALLLVILIISLSIPHIPISRHCNSLYYDILHNMNPFHIKRFVPV